MQQLLELFDDWIRSIKLTDKIKLNSKFADVADFDTDFFLTFNYTKTLETLYKANKVCHIHGVQGEKIIFGHGKDEVDSDQYSLDMTGAEDYLHQIEKSLRKNSNEAMEKSAWFFQALYKIII